ncbi:1-phosphatidylinositol 4,5-bisphosphate phosphodiesterase delta-1-like isoform X2 [Gigantopelta aegis]|uniref:1-phosphatidylinositol 4,5-bisphosphate phosphodiesterase delta-1-like isoform X2 n=1 Tax=Gigantopelta aegis TaxID=1735272 RepID=UPI001B88CA44|nr:1-phosphatidylinositol 4,5-bisphosphate phosphodiesterase delta-1-like isoform X2 [Gigantopelta aegis]
MDFFGCAGKSKHRVQDEDKTAYELKQKKTNQTADELTDIDRTSPEDEEPAVFDIPFWLVDQEEVDRIFAELRKGTTLYKVKSPTKLLQRRFYLDNKKMVLYYEGTQKTFRSANTEIKIHKIQEVRAGEKDFSKKLHGLDKNRCFAIVMGASHKITYLMASDQAIRDTWIRGIQYAMQMEKLEEQRNEIDKWVRDAFNMADKNGDGALDLDEVMKLLKKLNADIKKKYVQEMFKAADTNKDGRKNVLDREEFVKFYHQLTRRPELEEIFLKNSRGKPFLTVAEFLSFLKESQKMVNVKEEDCRQLIDLYEPTEVWKQRGHLSDMGFRMFLTNKKQQLFNPSHSNVYQDMTKPMTHYFIASSHNTYLTEDQLKGPSKVEAYITALTKGCRCVELDCWDGPNNEPIIYHGYTLTSKILFKDVIHVVKEYAFKATPYPLILSLENHCSVDQQKVMAQHIEEILGDMVYAPQEEIETAPSPEDLKMKIILKGKKKTSSSTKGKKLPPTQDIDDVSDEDEAQETENLKEEEKKPDKHKLKLAPELSRLTALKSVGFKDCEQAISSGGAYCIYSLGESKVEKLIQSQPSGLNVVTHTKLIRTYPSGSRTDSSNYRPIEMWNHGCQVVALNYQTGTEPMQLNCGRFLDNGASGYILKPSILMSEDAFTTVTKPEARATKKIFNIEIISGYQIPKPKNSSKGEVIDPFIKIEVHGVASDHVEKRTKTINNNGFNPRWKEVFTFEVQVPELALVRFVIKDEDRGKDDFIGFYCLPFTSIQQGYRHFPLFDKHGEQLSQTLIFVKIQITEPADS